MGTTATDPQELFYTHQHADVFGAYRTDEGSYTEAQLSKLHEELEQSQPVFAGGYYA